MVITVYEHKTIQKNKKSEIYTKKIKLDFFFKIMKWQGIQEIET